MARRAEIQRKSNLGKRKVGRIFGQFSLYKNGVCCSVSGSHMSCVLQMRGLTPPPPSMEKHVLSISKRHNNQIRRLVCEVLHKSRFKYALEFRRKQTASGFDVYTTPRGGAILPFSINQNMQSATEVWLEEGTLIIYEYSFKASY